MDPINKLHMWRRWDQYRMVFFFLPVSFLFWLTHKQISELPGINIQAIHISFSNFLAVFPPLGIKAFWITIETMSSVYCPFIKISTSEFNRWQKANIWQIQNRVLTLSRKIPLSRTLVSQPPGGLNRIDWFQKVFSPLLSIHLQTANIVFWWFSLSSESGSKRGREHNEHFQVEKYSQISLTLATVVTVVIM